MSLTSGRYLWVNGYLSLRPGFGNFWHKDMMEAAIRDGYVQKPITGYIGGDYSIDPFHAGIPPHITVKWDVGDHPTPKEIGYLVEQEMAKGIDRESVYRERVAVDQRSVEDTEPANNFGFMKDPHNELYPCAWEGSKMRPEALNKLKAHVLNEIELEFQQPDQFIYFTVYGSGASYNWDEDGDFDIQMWIDITKFGELHEDKHDMTQDDLLSALRRIVQQVNFPSFAELGLATDECEGNMLIQYYPKPGTGSEAENLAQKPYACYDMETDEWIVRPKPLTPEFYGEHFLMVVPKAEDIAIQAEAAIDELERNIVNWQFWYGMWSRYKNHKYKEQFTNARDIAEQQREAVKVLFEGVFGGRQEAYAEGGQGIEDERDVTQKLLEVWGIFQKLKHYARVTLPWEEQELPVPPDAESDSDESEEDKDGEENTNEKAHALITSRWKLAGSEDFQQFFEDASRGLYAPQGQLDLSFDQPHLQQFYDTYKGHAGNFDQHIETSIPGYREVQVRKGAAITQAFPNASVLDIGGSEGSWGKAVSQLGGQRTVNVEPNNAMAEQFAANPVQNAELVPHAFGEGFAEYPKFEPNEQYDIINESMTFQFISPERTGQIAEVKRLLKPGGLFITDEKVITQNWHENERVKDEWKKQFYTQDQLAEKQQVVNYQDEESAVGMVSNMIPQQDLENILRQNFHFVQNYWSSGNFQGYLASDSQETINKFLQAYGTYAKAAFFKKADWGEVTEHAQRARGTGQIVIQNKMLDPDSGQLHVIGQVPSESEPGTFHETEFWQDDPDSEAITLWSCDCPWGQKSWGRTRQWKRYEGRPCAHLLALYWESLGQPLSADAEQAQQTQLQQMEIPGLGQGPQQWVGPTTPGGPNLPSANPLPVSPPAIDQPLNEPQPAFSEPKQPNNTSDLEFPGTLSKWARDEWTPENREARDWLLNEPMYDLAMSETKKGYSTPYLAQSLRAIFYEHYSGGDLDHWMEDYHLDPNAIDWMELAQYFKTMALEEQQYEDQSASDLTLPESWSRRTAAFTNGDTVRNSIPVQGFDRDGTSHVIPRNSSGEVIWSDDVDTIVIFPLTENSYLEPHLVRAQGPTEAFYKSPSFNPGPRRRR
jgi:SAM-dependent methyltransferase